MAGHAEAGRQDGLQPAGDQLSSPAGDLGAAPKFDGTDMWPVLPDLLNDPTDITKWLQGLVPDQLRDRPTPGSRAARATWCFSALSISGYLAQPDHRQRRHLVCCSPPTTRAAPRASSPACFLRPRPLTTQLQAKPARLVRRLALLRAHHRQHRGPDHPRPPTSSRTARRIPDSRPCDGISIGLGFDAEVVQLGPIAPRAGRQAEPVRHGRRWRRWGRRRRDRRRLIDVRGDPQTPAQG